MFLVRDKWGTNSLKEERLKTFKRNMKKLRKVLASGTYNITKYRIHHAVFLSSNFLTFSLDLLLKPIENLDKNWKYELKNHFIYCCHHQIWSNPKATVWKGSEKFMYLNIYDLKEASADELYSSIRRYFLKHW